MAIAVRLSGRPFVAVVADMIDGVLAANRLAGQDAEEWRRRLWCSLEAMPGIMSEAA